MSYKLGTDIYNNKIFLGGYYDYEQVIKLEDEKLAEWYIITFANEIYEVEYVRSIYERVSKTEPFALFMTSHRALYNILDDFLYSDIKTIFNSALLTMHTQIKLKKKILLHCILGQSRSASLALVYLYKYTDILSGSSMEEVEEKFRGIYSNYNPTNKMRKSTYMYIKDTINNTFSE